MEPDDQRTESGAVGPRTRRSRRHRQDDVLPRWSQRNKGARWSHVAEEPRWTEVSTGRGGAMGPEAGCVAKGSSRLGGAGGLKTLGRSLLHVGDAEGQMDISEGGAEELAL